jgi:hypothetical protein
MTDWVDAQLDSSVARLGDNPSVENFTTSGQVAISISVTEPAVIRHFTRLCLFVPETDLGAIERSNKSLHSPFRYYHRHKRRRRLNWYTDHFRTTTCN